MRLTRKTGEQISVACNNCRQRKSKVSISPQTQRGWWFATSAMLNRFPHTYMLTSNKCNGERPSCKICRDRKETCEYTSEPGISPIASLKRKYESLQAESADEHDLLGFLRTASEGDAIKLLAYLRSSDDIQSTLYQARNSLDTLGESLGQAAPDMAPLRPADRPVTQPDSQATSDPIDAPSIYPELSEHNGRVPWALPIEPYVRWCILLAVSR